MSRYNLATKTQPAVLVRLIKYDAKPQKTETES